MPSKDPMGIDDIFARATEVAPDMITNILAADAEVARERRITDQLLTALLITEQSMPDTVDDRIAQAERHLLALEKINRQSQKMLSLVLPCQETKETTSKALWRKSVSVVIDEARALLDLIDIVEKQIDQAKEYKRRIDAQAEGELADGK